ncbi:MAG TPA: hypothetical protein VHU61_08470 [Solirubrobacteraceae bacterium]|jgi:hypothetical protein|nr:hypothetical protein [Solirubrobacteraceae bacterium]
MTEFEDRLWERLVDEHGADAVTLAVEPERRNRRALVGGSAALATVSAAAVVAFAATGGATPAYAMTQNADGSYTFTINDLATAVPELNAKFKQLGIEETVIPVEAGCSTVNPFLLVNPHETMSDSFTFEPGGKWVDPGYHGVIAAEQLPDGDVAIMEGAIAPPIPSCYSTQAFTDKQIGDANGVPTITAVPVTPSTPAKPGS